MGWGCWVGLFDRNFLICYCSDGMCGCYDDLCLLEVMCDGLFSNVVFVLLGGSVLVVG